MRWIHQKCVTFSTRTGLSPQRSAVDGGWLPIRICEPRGPAKVAAALIFVLAMLRLIDSPPRDAIVTSVVLCAISLGADAARDTFQAWGNLNLVVFFVGFVGIVGLIGVPIAFAFGSATLSYLALSTSVPLNTVADRMDEGMSNPILLAIPLFIVLGVSIELSGVARRIVNAIAALVGRLRGGLSIVLVVLCIGLGNFRLEDRRHGSRRTGVVSGDGTPRSRTPPLGVGFYSARAIGKAPPDLAARRVVPYIIALVVALGIVAAFPQTAHYFVASRL